MKPQKAKKILAAHNIDESVDFAYAMNDSLILIIYTANRFVVALDDEHIHFVQISLIREKPKQYFKIPVSAFETIDITGVIVRIGIKSEFASEYGESLNFDVPIISLRMTEYQKKFRQQLKILKENLI